MTNKLTSVILSASFAAVAMYALPNAQDQPMAAAPSAPQTTAKPHHAPDPNRQLKTLANKLALTGDQQTRILPILTDRDQQITSIQNDTTLSKKDLHEKLKAVRSDSEAKLRAVLTDTQREAYDQMQQDARERARNQHQTGVKPI